MSGTDPNVPAPMFTAADMSASTQQAVAQKGTPATLNLDDIFGDVMFTPDGDTVFLSEEQDVMNSAESQVTNMASKKRGDQFVQVNQGGGLYTTQLMEHGKVSTTMGTADKASAKTAAVPFKKAPQERHHLQYANKKKSRSSDRKMSEQQKTERRYVLHCWLDLDTKTLSRENLLGGDRFGFSCFFRSTLRSGIFRFRLLAFNLCLHPFFLLIVVFSLVISPLNCPKQKTGNGTVNTPREAVSVKSFSWNLFSKVLPYSKKKMKNFVRLFVIIWVMTRPIS